jgi:hypothetical protein
MHGSATCGMRHATCGLVTMRLERHAEFHLSLTSPPAPRCRAGARAGAFSSFVSLSTRCCLMQLLSWVSEGLWWDRRRARGGPETRFRDFYSFCPLKRIRGLRGSHRLHQRRFRQPARPPTQPTHPACCAAGSAVHRRSGSLPQTVCVHQPPSCSPPRADRHPLTPLPRPPDRNSADPNPVSLV